MTSLKSVPTLFKRLVVKKLTPLFSEAVTVVTEPIVRPQVNQVLIKNRYVGINASDINVAAGRYQSLLFNKTLPFGLGFEGVGEVVALGEEVSDLSLGQPVMYMGTNSFAEYVYQLGKDVIPIVSAQPEFIPLLVSGTTSSLSLDKSGQIAPGETVLITAAAGGTGHLAVQWAKNAGCYVIGLCSSQEKVDFLKSIGCDHPINYKQEPLEMVLKEEYPKGIDVVWETVGGELFNTLMGCLAIKGRMVIVGSISGYKEETLTDNLKIANMPLKLLLHSSTITGFLLTHYNMDIPHYLSLLVRLMHEKKLRVQIDVGENTSEGAFIGLNDIPRAVEYLYSGKNKGKVIVGL